MGQLTQGQLAQRLTDIGIPMAQQTIAKIETGSRPLKLAEAEAITSILVKPLTVLIPGDEDDALEVSELHALMNHYSETLEAAALRLADAARSRERLATVWSNARPEVRRAFLEQAGGSEQWIDEILSREIAAQAAETAPPGAEFDFK